jgi:peroxiredoxin (alkyl hydroperoxide reductase subunit C)
MFRIIAAAFIAGRSIHHLKLQSPLHFWNQEPYNGPVSWGAGFPIAQGVVLMKLRIVAATALMFALSLLPLLAQQPSQPPVARTHLKVGDEAPDFTLPDNAFQQVKLSDFRGKKNVVLAFYVLAFTGG